METHGNKTLQHRRGLYNTQSLNAELYMFILWKQQRPKEGRHKKNCNQSPDQQ